MVPAMDPRTFEYYRGDAEARADFWERAPGPLENLFPHLFRTGQAVLDVGCGSGRDCATLLRLGIDARGIDPVPELCSVAIERHPELAGRIENVTVAEYAAVHPTAFEGILLSAMLMHVPDSELFDLVVNLRKLLRPGATLAVSIPVERSDVDPDSSRDEYGRLFILRDESTVALLFERLGFTVESTLRSNDTLGRDATWVTIVFRYNGESPRPIDRVESIINRDRKTSTYKFALLRALSEIATNTPSMGTAIADGAIAIFLDEVAILWVQYYWPLLDGPDPIPQNWNGKGPVRFFRQTRELIDAYSPFNGLSAWFSDVRSGQVPTAMRKLHRNVIREIKTALKTGPITYAGDNEFSHSAGQLIIR